MKASLAFKKKAHKSLNMITHPATMLAAMLLGAAGAFGPELHYELTKTEAQTTAQEQEYAALEKRVGGIAPMRKYVTQLQEQADVVLKLPADALPAGTDAAKLRAQGEKLTAAYNAEVMNTAVAIGFAPNISFSEARNLGSALRQATGTKHDYILTREADGAINSAKFHACQAEITARKDIATGKDALLELRNCAEEKQFPVNLALGGALLGGFTLLAASLVFGRKLGEQIKAEEAAQPAVAAPDAPSAPPINTATGQDITVKPIKITAKTAP